MIWTIPLNYHHAIILTLRSLPILTVSKPTMMIKFLRDTSKKEVLAESNVRNDNCGAVNNRNGQLYVSWT